MAATKPFALLEAIAGAHAMEIVGPPSEHYA